MGLPGVKIGPLDPDATSQFGQVSAKNSARTLIRLHTQMHPPHLVRALALKLDPERTKGLDLEEVSDYLATLKLENGDPLVPEDATIVGASVRGEPGTKQVLTFTYQQPVPPHGSGRTAKWYAPYTAEGLPESFDAGAELAKVKEMTDRGIVSFDSEGTASELLRRENADLRREARALRSQVEARGEVDDDGEVPEAEGDSRPADQIVEELEAKRREVEDLRARLALLGDDEGAPPASAGAASEDPPLDKYDEINARDLASRLKSEDTSDEERQRVLDYERSHQNRKTVVAAAEESLGARSG